MKANEERGTVGRVKGRVLPGTESAPPPNIPLLRDSPGADGSERGHNRTKQDQSRKRQMR